MSKQDHPDAEKTTPASVALISGYWKYENKVRWPLEGTKLHKILYRKKNRRKKPEDAKKSKNTSFTKKTLTA